VWVAMLKAYRKLDDKPSTIEELQTRLHAAEDWEWTSSETCGKGCPELS